MTDFTMSPLLQFTFEDLTWDLTPPEGAFVLSGTLDVTALNAAQHYANGYVKSGLVLAQRSTDQLLVPYIAAGANATGTAVGLLRASVPVTRLVGGTNRTKIGVAFMVHGMVSQAKLPYTSGNAAAGGFVDANAKTNLPNIVWTA